MYGTFSEEYEGDEILASVASISIKESRIGFSDLFSCAHARQIDGSVINLGRVVLTVDVLN